jgi:hypothetical protein
MDEDEIEAMLEMLKQKRGISVHHLSAKEYEESWPSRWWDINRYGSKVYLPGGTCVLT